MNAKRILLIVLCALLVIMLTLTGIVLSKFSGLLGLLNPPAPTPTDPTTPSEAPTEPQSTEHVHDYALTETISATCTGYGWNVYNCQTCDHMHMPTSERTDPLGHSYDDGKVTAADCTTGGFTEYTCTRCGHTDIPAEAQTDPLGHNYDHGLILEATCTEGGHTKFTCLRCGIDEIKDQTEALGHQYGDTLSFPATCTEDAYTVTTCARCAVEDKVIEVGSATGHTPSDWTVLDTGEIAQMCTTCLLPTAAAEDGKPYEILLSLEQAHADDSGEGVAYISHTVTIGVSGDAEENMFTYTVNDYLCNATLALSYQPELGFVMEYTDQDGANQRYFINHTAPLTITVNLTGAPTVE